MNHLGIAGFTSLQMFNCAGRPHPCVVNGKYLRASNTPLYNEPPVVDTSGRWAANDFDYNPPRGYA